VVVILAARERNAEEWHDEKETDIMEIANMRFRDKLCNV